MNTLQRFEFPLLQSKQDANLECWAGVLSNGCVVCKLGELAEFLNYRDEQSALEHVPSEWAPTWRRLKSKIAHDPSAVDWDENARFLMEPGIYALLARHLKPADRDSVKYVCEMILPAIRETGDFAAGAVAAPNRVRALEAQLMEARAENQALLANYEAALAGYRTTLLAMEKRIRHMEHHYQQRTAGRDKNGFVDEAVDMN